jgi:hypothetical protein
MNTNTSLEVRRECLQPAIYYAEPTGAEIQETIRLAGFNGRMGADYLGLADKTGRQIRRWASGDARIPYSAWALLCYAAGFGHIWEMQKPNGPGSKIARDAEN